MDGRGRGCVAGYAGGLGAEKTKGWGRARIIWAKMDTEPNLRRLAIALGLGLEVRCLPGTRRS